MIKNEAQAVLYDVLDGEAITLDVNFDEERNDCVKITLGKKTAIVKYTDLFSFMFCLGTKEQQAKMIPVTQQLGSEYMKTISIKTTKDLKAGEVITVNAKIHVPTIIEEQIRYELSQSPPSPYAKETAS